MLIFTKNPSKNNTVKNSPINAQMPRKMDKFNNPKALFYFDKEDKNIKKGYLKNNFYTN
jgi:hypothetical protein